MKPILFSTPMVQAILKGNKTQTRRVKKSQKPRYNVGDILYVRETWGIGIQLAGLVLYKADYLDKKAPLADGEKWKPSIHMPKDIARIFLKITNIQHEKIQDITEKESIHEGLNSKEDFIKLWDILNNKRGFGWNNNPDVWVITFKKINKCEVFYD